MSYRVIITGSRKYDWRSRIHQYLALKRHYFSDLVVVVGGCYSGADAIAQVWADDHKVPYEVHPADWEGFGLRAGPMRNSHVVSLGANEVGAFWLPSRHPKDNRGTRDLCTKAWKEKIPVMACWGDAPMQPWHGALFAGLVK